MLRETLSQTQLLDLPLYAFMIFLVTFAVVVVRVMARGRKDPQAAAMALLPLEDDSELHTRNDAQPGDDR